MIDKIVAQLKTGRIKNVIPFGDPITAPPYIVVRGVKDIAGRGTQIIVTTHMKPGQQNFLEDYCTKDIATLLEDFKSATRNGNYNLLLQENMSEGIMVNNSDGTISMERWFLLPSLIF